MLNRDAAACGRSNLGNAGGVTSEDHAVHNQRHSALFSLPPLSVIVFQAER